jgi:uroporphyrinogen-III decarboxylase
MVAISEDRINEIWERYNYTWMRESGYRTPFKYNVQTAQPNWEEDFLFDYEKLMNFQLKNIEGHYEKRLQDDYLPIVYPSYGTGVLATSFGSKTLFRKNSLPAYTPVIFSPEQAKEIEKPELLEKGCFSKILEMTKKMDKELPSNCHLGLYDIQGPLDMAWVIWEPINLVKSMFTEKEVVHEFLGICTEVLIESIRMQLEVISNPVPFGHVDVYLPMGMGLVISDDVIANLSPYLYKEFGVPYNTRLSNEFNGLAIHSCGNFEQNLENLVSIPSLRGVDYGVTETKTEAMSRICDQTTLHMHGGLYWEKHYTSTKDLVDKERYKLPKGAPMIFSLWQHPDEKDVKRVTDEILTSLSQM